MNKKIFTKEIILYFIFGILTTIIDTVIFYICSDILHINYILSTCIAWCFAVLFAYITNKLFVFSSKNNNIFKEIISFFSLRLVSLLLSIIFMVIMVSMLQIPSVISKFLVNFVVVLANYIFSKLYIFNKKGNNMNKNFFTNNKYIFIGGIATSIILLITFIASGFYPFGENSILRVDLYHQYAPFHQELRDKLLSGDSLFYSFKGGLGKEFLSQIAYYTASPISLLILFFKTKYISEAILFFVFIKIILCSLTFSYYLKSTFKKNTIFIALFGIMYSFIAYTTSFYWNIMWLDSIYLLPIVILGIDRLVKKGKYKTYLFSLMLCILVNFYIAFLVCIFITLYFIIKLLSSYKIKKNQKIILNRIIKFAIISILAGGSTMVLAIPTIVALGHTQTSGASFPSFEIYQNVYQMITNHFSGAKPVVLARNEDLPNVYSGVFTMILLPIYFFNKKIHIKEKALFGGLIVFMLSLSVFKQLDFLIHGGHFPANLPHRYTFIYSFILLILAYKGFLHIKGVKNIVLYVSFVVYTSIILITEFIFVRQIDDISRVLSNSDIIINIALMLIYITFLIIYKNNFKNNKKLIPITFILIFTICGESLFNSINGFFHSGTTDRQKYIKYIEPTENILTYIKETDKDANKFFRQEFSRFTAINESVMYGYNGFSIFSSLAYGDTAKLLQNLGMASTGNSYRYYDPTPLIDSMFNIKYIMAKNNTLENANYEFIKKFDNINLYKNKTPLSVGFMVDNDILDWETKNKNPFITQNDFVKKATDISENIFTPVEIKDFKGKNVDITQKNHSKNEYKYTLHDETNLSLSPTITAKIQNPKKQRLFLYIESTHSKRFKYKINNHKYDRELSTGRSLIDLGIVDNLQNINIEFSLDRKGSYDKVYSKKGSFRVYACGFDEDIFKKTYKELEDEMLIVNKYDSTSINGKISAKKDGIMFTSIPYDDGFSVYIDDKKTNILPIGNGGLIGIYVPKGSHDIQFKYYVKGFNLGLSLTVLSFILIGLYILLENKKSFKKSYL